MVKVKLLNAGSMFATVEYEGSIYGILTEWLREIDHNYAYVDRSYLTNLSRIRAV